MKELILKPDCLGCEKPIDKPSDCDMEAFRYGFPLHNDCLKIFDRINTHFQRFKAGRQMSDAATW